MACITDTRGRREIGKLDDFGDLNHVFRSLVANIFPHLKIVYLRWRLQRLGINPDSIFKIRRLRRRTQAVSKFKDRTTSQARLRIRHAKQKSTWTVFSVGTTPL